MQHLSNSLLHYILKQKYNEPFAILIQTLQKPYSLYDLLKEFKIQKKNYKDKQDYEILLNLSKLKLYLLLAIKHSFIDINQEHLFQINYFAVLAQLFIPQIYHYFQHDPKLQQIFEFCQKNGTFTYLSVQKQFQNDLLTQFKYLIENRFIVYADQKNSQVQVEQKQEVNEDKKTKKNKKASQKTKQTVNKQMEQTSLNDDNSKLLALIQNLDTKEYYFFKFNYKAILQQLTRQQTLNIIEEKLGSKSRSIIEQLQQSEGIVKVSSLFDNTKLGDQEIQIQKLKTLMGIGNNDNSENIPFTWEQYLIRKLRQSFINRWIQGKYSESHATVFEILRSDLSQDDKQICNKGLINIKDVRKILLEFLRDGLINYEELPLEKEKTTKMVYTYDSEKIKFKIMLNFYKTILNLRVKLDQKQEQINPDQNLVHILQSSEIEVLKEFLIFIEYD